MSNSEKYDFSSSNGSCDDEIERFKQDMYIEKDDDSPFMRRMRKLAKSAHAIAERDKDKDSVLCEDFRYKSKTLDLVLSRLKGHNSTAEVQDASFVIRGLVDDFYSVYDGFDSELLAAQRFNDQKKIDDIYKDIEKANRRLNTLCSTALDLGVSYDDLSAYFDDDDDSTVALMWDRQLQKYYTGE